MINLIESKINFGFGKGNNEAIKQAKGKYLLLFNNDTILLDNLEPIVSLLENKIIQNTSKESYLKLME